jgi:hypothetical protein
MGYIISGTPQTQAVGDLALITFPYLLCIGKYAVKGKHNNTKQKVQFKLKYATLFKTKHQGILYASRRMHTSPYSCLLTAQR